MIEKGRHYNIDREARTYCETCIENELHLVLQCPLFARCRYLHDMFVNDVSEGSYVCLMSSDNETTVKKFFGGKIICIPLNRHVQNHYIMYLYINCKLLLLR